jgi:hypothetical protein
MKYILPQKARRTRSDGARDTRGKFFVLFVLFVVKSSCPRLPRREIFPASFKLRQAPFCTNSIRT